jgi:hypothetical protein
MDLSSFIELKDTFKRIILKPVDTDTVISVSSKISNAEQFENKTGTEYAKKYIEESKCKALQV